MLSAGDCIYGDDYNKPKLQWALSQWDHPVNFTYRLDGRGEEWLNGWTTYVEVEAHFTLTIYS